MSTLVTSAAGLLSAYGQDGYQAILKSLQALAQAQGTPLRVLDDASTMQGGAPAKSQDPNDLRAAIASLKPQVISIIGDQRVFPSFSVANPVSDRSIDPDPMVLTDNPYGDFAGSQPGDCLLPAIAVGRIAPGVSDSAQDFCNLLNWQLTLKQNKPLRTGYVEVTSRQWQDTSNFVLSAAAARVFVSPDDRFNASNAANLDCRYLYCNLHGFLNNSAWMGYDQGLSYPVPAITPDAFQSQYVSGAVVFTEACYGLATSGKATNSSCALSLLAAGAGAVVGATGLAFGTATFQPQNLLDADVMARVFFNSALNQGTVGTWLLNARTQLSQTSSLSDVYVRKTLLEFQILGDPSYAPS